MLRKTLIVSILFLSYMFECMGQQTREHLVQKGETVSSIAVKYGVSESMLLDANPSAASFIYVGMVLVIPEPIVVSPTSTSPLQSEAPVQKFEEKSGVDLTEIGIKILDFAADYSVRNAGGYAFFFKGGFGLGGQVVPFRKLPIGFTLEYWSGKGVDNYSLSVDLSPRIPLALEGALSITPQLGLGYHSLNLSEAGSQSGVFVRIHPMILYRLPWLDGFDISAGYLYNTYGNTSGNLTIGLYYSF